MAQANRIEGIGGGSPRGVGGISGAGGKNVNPVYKELGNPTSRATLAASENKKAIAEAARNAKNTEIKDKVIAELRLKKNWKELTPEESAKIKADAKKNSIERIKKGMG